MQSHEQFLLNARKRIQILILSRRAFYPLSLPHRYSYLIVAFIKRVHNQ